MPPGKLCPAELPHAKGPMVSQTPAREPRQLRYLGSTTWTPGVLNMQQELLLGLVKGSQHLGPGQFSPSAQVL